MAITERHPTGGEPSVSYGEIEIGVVGPDDNLEKIARAKLESNPGIEEAAKRNSFDLVAFSKSHRKVIIAGFGLAASALAAGGGIILYEHNKKK